MTDVYWVKESFITKEDKDAAVKIYQIIGIQLVLILANAALRILDGKTQCILQYMISREYGTIA